MSSHCFMQAVYANPGVHYGPALLLQGSMCFYWSGIALLYSDWFRHAVHDNPGVPSVLHYHYSTSRVPIGQDELYCILVGIGMQFTPILGPNSQRYSISDRTVNAGALLIAQIYGYLLGLKSIKTMIVGLQKI
jgi:hypothetical protein